LIKFNKVKECYESCIFSRNNVTAKIIENSFLSGEKYSAHFSGKSDIVFIGNNVSESKEINLFLDGNITVDCEDNKIFNGKNVGCWIKGKSNGKFINNTISDNLENLRHDFFDSKIKVKDNILK
jgi:parallel beta-helix repeat protein